MKNPIAISEITKEVNTASPFLINNQIKITNTSEDFVNNVKLLIHTPSFTICEESVIRQRGIMSFTPETQCLDLGNLAPNESAYFEYKFLSPSSLSSLSQHFSITYTDAANTTVSEKKIADYLSATSSDND